MERKIGEIFEYNGEWYQCVEGNSCADCAFYEEPCNRNPLDETIGSCRYYREDATSVIFKKLEKVGEPFERNGYMYQEHKAHTYPLLMSGGAKIPTYNGFAVIIKQNKEDMEEKNNGNTPLNVLTDKYVNGDICYDDFEKEVKALYSCKEEIKPTLKEFDLEAARLGKPVCTRDGHKARIICFDAKDTQPIIGLYEKNIDGIVREYLCSYHTDGRIYDDQDTGYDLMMLPEKRSGWAKVRKDINLYDTKEEADRKMIGNDDYVTAKVFWEE